MSSKPNMRARRPLQRVQILDAAIALADAEGIEAVSMRRLGSVLGVQAMSLYNHVENKRDLLDGMAGRLLGLMEIPAVDEMSWHAALRTICYSYRRLAHEHPSFFPYVQNRPLMSQESLRPLEAVLAILLDEGFDANTAFDAFQVCARFVAGFAMSEIGRGVVGTEITEPWSGFPSLARMKDNYPATAIVLAHAIPDYDRAFELGLDSLVEGLDRRPRLRAW